MKKKEIIKKPRFFSSYFQQGKVRKAWSPSHGKSDLIAKPLLMLSSSWIKRRSERVHMM